MQCRCYKNFNAVAQFQVTKLQRQMHAICMRCLILPVKKRLYLKVYLQDAA